MHVLSGTPIVGPCLHTCRPLSKIAQPLLFPPLFWAHPSFTLKRVTVIEWNVGEEAGSRMGEGAPA